MPKRESLSIVVPVFNEEQNLPELRRRLKRIVDELRFEHNEVLLVSDGSTDESEAMIRSIVAEDPLFQGVFLTRNFGHQAAVSTGLSRAKGSVVVVIDGDLQDPPEAILLLIGAIDDGADVAYAVRNTGRRTPSSGWRIPCSTASCGGWPTSTFPWTRAISRA